jgi:hypothetical protein
MLTFVVACMPAFGADKLPIPPDAALNRPLAVIKEVYGKEHADAKTNLQLQTLAKKMFSQAMTAKDPIERYALLRVARDIATHGCDGQTAFQIIDEMDQTYQLDAFRMKASVLYSLTQKARLPADRRSIAEKALALADQAVARDDFELSDRLTQMSLAEARKLRDGGFVRFVSNRKQEIDEIGKAYENVRTSAKRLEENPTDPEANLTVGKYRCFVKGDWDNGLAMLALGNDPTLKGLAAKELENPADTGEQLKVADGWWNVSESQGGKSRHHCQLHAAYWYAAALPHLDGLSKAKAASRIDITGTDSSAEVVDLLPLANPTTHTLSGKWHRRNGELYCQGGGVCILQFPLRPPAEYDFRITFTRERGDEAVVLLCSAAGRQFSWCIGGYHNRFSIFRRIAGHGDERGIENNPTCRKSEAWIVNTRRSTWTVKVRKDKVQAWQGGQLISEWKTDYSDMSPEGKWKMARSDTLALGALDPTVFHSAQIVKVTGRR